MPHDLTLISTIAAGLGFAFVGGFIATRLGCPPLVGYLLAGIAVGPFTPGFVADTALAPQLAEIGVILLMFGVGMHFSIRDLLAVKNVAVPGAITQIVVATALGAGVAVAWGWSIESGILFGLSLSVASTVVLLRALDAQGKLESPVGSIAVGWLIVEDLIIVVALVVIPVMQNPAGQALAAEGSLGLKIGLTLLKVTGFIALMLVFGLHLFPWLLKQVERTSSRELFTLAVASLAIGVAFGSYVIFGVSLALGAFFAGVVINQSDLSHRAALESQPLQDIFGVLFFVSVGMLFDPQILLQQPLKVLAVVAVIVVGKSLAAIAIVLALRHPLSTALTVAAALAQIGEFSFILAGLGLTLGLLSAEGNNLILAGALISISLNPLTFRLFSALAKRRPIEGAARGRLEKSDAQ